MTAEDEVDFAVWREDGSEADAQRFCAPNARAAAEMRARWDWMGGQESWPVAYCVRDGETGDLWAVTVMQVTQPAFVATGALVPMSPATHVLWGGKVLCEDPRLLRGVPRDWPADQRWISLADVADGAEEPADRCAACWAKAPALVEGIRQIGTKR